MTAPFCPGCPDHEACMQGGCHLDGGPVHPLAAGGVVHATGREVMVGPDEPIHPKPGPTVAEVADTITRIVYAVAEYVGRDRAATIIEATDDPAALIPALIAEAERRGADAARQAAHLAEVALDAVTAERDLERGAVAQLTADVGRLRQALVRAMTSAGCEATDEHGDDWLTVAAEEPDTFPDTAVDAIRDMRARWVSEMREVGESWRKRYAAAIPDDIDPGDVRAMLALLGPSRMVLDRAAVLLGEQPGQPGHEAAQMAQRIVDLIGHPVTDEPPHALVERDRLRAELESARVTIRALLQHPRPEDDPARALWDAEARAETLRQQVEDAANDREEDSAQIDGLLSQAKELSAEVERLRVVETASIGAHALLADAEAETERLHGLLARALNGWEARERARCPHSSWVSPCDRPGCSCAADVDALRREAAGS